MSDWHVKCERCADESAGPEGWRMFYELNGAVGKATGWLCPRCQREDKKKGRSLGASRPSIDGGL